MIYWIEPDLMPVLLSSTLSVTGTFDQMPISSRRTTARPPFDVIASSNYRCLPSPQRYHVRYYFVAPFTLIDSLSTATAASWTVLTAAAMTTAAAVARRGHWQHAHYRYVLGTTVCWKRFIGFLLSRFFVVEQQNTVLFSILINQRAIRTKHVSFIDVSLATHFNFAFCFFFIVFCIQFYCPHSTRAFVIVCMANMLIDSASGGDGEGASRFDIDCQVNGESDFSPKMKIYLIVNGDVIEPKPPGWGRTTIANSIALCFSAYRMMNLRNFAVFFCFLHFGNFLS